MQRREFFQTGALGMATLLARGAQGSTDIRLSASQMDQFLLQLDKKQALMANTLAEGFLGAPVAAADPAERARCLTLLRKVLRSMHLTRSFRDLPEHGRAHPGMQRRMAAALPEIDEAVSGARSFLFELSPADRLDLQRTIVQNPELLPKMASHVEDASTAAGIAPELGGQLRRQIEHLDRQMRRSNVGVLLDDYLGRSERTMAEAGTVAEMTQRLRDRLGAPAFYTFAQRQEALARSWWEQPPPTEYPGAGDVFQMDGVAWSEQLSQVRHRKYLTGAILLGVGLILTGPGLAFIPWTLGLSSIAATPGIPILIAGISLMAINGRRRP